jgi:hypothetical protein
MHIAALFVFPSLGGFICICTHTCISFLFGLEWKSVGHILLTIPTNFIDVGAFCKLIKKQRFSRFVTKAGWVCTAKGPKSTISILRLEARGRIE